jgi:hypothetical protein
MVRDVVSCEAHRDSAQHPPRSSLDLQSPSLKIAEEAARSYWVIPGDAEAVLTLTEVLLESRN